MALARYRCLATAGLVIAGVALGGANASASPQASSLARPQPRGAAPAAAQYRSFFVFGGSAATLSARAARLGRSASLVPEAGLVRADQAQPIAALSSHTTHTYLVDAATGRSLGGGVRPRPRAASPRTSAAGVTALNRPSSDYDYCLNDSRSTGSGGWVDSRYLLCRAGGFSMQRIAVINGTLTVVGQLNYRFVQISLPLAGLRAVDVAVRVDQLSTSGEFNSGTLLTSGMSCQARTAGSACSADAAVTRTVSGWRVTNDYDTYLHSSGGGGKDTLAFADEHLNSKASDSGGSATAAAPSNSFRCDSATYTAKSTGCIQDQAIPAINYSVSDANVNEVAQHIFDAQVQPQYTVPPVAGKKVPGRVEGPFIHRLYYDTSRRTANHASAVNACKQYFGTNYTSGGRSCDEYPFQSVAEGQPTATATGLPGPLTPGTTPAPAATSRPFMAANVCSTATRLP